MVDIVSYDGGRIVDFGERVRIERRARAERGADGAPLYRWVLYEKVVAEPDEKGRRIHPVLGRPTTLDDVWVPRDQVIRLRSTHSTSAFPISDAS